MPYLKNNMEIVAIRTQFWVQQWFQVIEVLGCKIESMN